MNRNAFPLLAIVFLLAGCSQAPADSPEAADTPQPPAGKFQACGDRTELFSVAPTDMDKINTMTPVGMMTPPDHVFPAPHMYFFPLDDLNPEDIEIPVYASADMVLTQIGLRHYNKIGEKANYIDYTLVFSPCNEFDLYFHHVRSLTYPPFAEAAERILEKCGFSAERNEDYCSGRVNIPIIAGEQIGTAVDIKAGVWGFDLGARDYRIPEGRSALLSSERHCSRERNVFDRCYTVCPFDYFTEDIRSGLEFSNGKFDIPGLACGGNLFFDIKGSAQGYWFEKGPGDKWGEEKNIFLGPNNLNPAVRAFSIRTAVPGVQAGLHVFSPAASGLVNRDFAEVSNDGNIYCYDAAVEYQERDGKAILIQLNNETLRIGPHSGNCGEGPWGFEEYAEFER